MSGRRRRLYNGSPRRLYNGSPRRLAPPLSHLPPFNDAGQPLRIVGVWSFHRESNDRAMWLAARCSTVLPLTVPPVRERRGAELPAQHQWCRVGYHRASQRSLRPIAARGGRIRRAIGCRRIRRARRPNDAGERRVPGPGLEPGRGYPHKILSLARLPLSPPRLPEARPTFAGTLRVARLLRKKHGSGMPAPVAFPTSRGATRSLRRRERETGLEPATPTLARLCSTN